MAENNFIKSITEHICPHCQGEIFIESQMLPPSINSVFTSEESLKAKDECINKINTLDIDQDKKDDVIKWIEDPSTIFGPNEIDNIILSLLKE